MKRMLFVILVVVLLVPLTAVQANGGGAVKGTAYDPDYPSLGEITYLGNRAGYHFWFTPTEDVAWYEAGHSYHNVYKFSVGDPSERVWKVGIIA